MKPDVVSYYLSSSVRIIKGTWLKVSMKHYVNVYPERERDLGKFLALMLHCPSHG